MPHASRSQPASRSRMSGAICAVEDKSEDRSAGRAVAVPSTGRSASSSRRVRGFTGGGE